jgi:3-oxoacyl-[acyl-carrier protein] reductase
VTSSPIFSLDGQLALVTGASRGIGLGIAQRLQSAGATVVGTATTEEGANRLSEILSHDGKSYAIALDVKNPEAIEHVLNTISTRSERAPSILVNNAGITRDNLLMRMKDEEWDSIIDTNLTGVYRVVRAVIKSMIKARYGRIINVGSVVGSSGNAGQTNYAAAKAALGGFSRALAQEVGSRNITVNVVAPGFIDTDMTKALSEEQRAALLGRVPSGRLGSVDDIASAVLYLASKEASYVTGTTLHVNGGLYMA